MDAPPVGMRECALFAYERDQQVLLCANAIARSD